MREMGEIGERGRTGQASVKNTTPRRCLASGKRSSIFRVVCARVLVCPPCDTINPRIPEPPFYNSLPHRPALPSMFLTRAFPAFPFPTP